MHVLVVVFKNSVQYNSIQSLSLLAANGALQGRIFSKTTHEANLLRLSN